MDLLSLSKRERFYYELGTALTMSNTRSYINMETLDVDFFGTDNDYGFDEDGEEIEEDGPDPDKFLFVEPVSSREAFEVMEAFVETVKDRHMQQRLTDALEGKKPFANFNRLVHDFVREQWFDFRDRTYLEKAKQWIEENASDELKEKIKALPAVGKVG